MSQHKIGRIIKKKKRNNKNSHLLHMVKTLTHINTSFISLRQVRPHTLCCHHSLISPSSSSSSTPRMYKTLLHLQRLKRSSEQTSLLSLKCDFCFSGCTFSFFFFNVLLLLLGLLFSIYPQFPLEIFFFFC